MQRFILVFLLAFATLSFANAQKYGHVNFGNLLNEMPATAAADKQMEAYQAELIAEGEALVKKWQEDVLVAQEKADTTPPIEMQKIEQDLRQREQEIRRFQQQISMKLEEKRRELLGPIIEKAKAAIDAVGKEQGYQLIFDSSLFNSVLFTEEGTDLMPAVKAKLGL
ncbi:MAG: OmpH family outer membrane protein [Bacteroidota bacterium]